MLKRFAYFSGVQQNWLWRVALFLFRRGILQDAGDEVPERVSAGVSLPAQNTVLNDRPLVESRLIRVTCTKLNAPGPSVVPAANE